MKDLTRKILIGVLVAVFVLTSVDWIDCNKNCNAYLYLAWWIFPLASVALIYFLASIDSPLKFFALVCFTLTLPIISILPWRLAQIFTKIVAEIFGFDYSLFFRSNGGSSAPISAPTITLIGSLLLF